MGANILVATTQPAFGELLRLSLEEAGHYTVRLAQNGREAQFAASRLAFEVGATLVMPPPDLCTDNGAMIAWAGCERLALGLTDSLDVAPRPRSCPTARWASP